jgi:hypothetical protein
LRLGAQFSDCIFGTFWQSWKGFQASVPLCK